MFCVYAYFLNSKTLTKRVGRAYEACEAYEALSRDAVEVGRLSKAMSRLSGDGREPNNLSIDTICKADGRILENI